jgi:hypothetical protein
VAELVHRDQQARAQMPGGEIIRETIGGRLVQTRSWLDPIAGLQHATFMWEEAGVRREKKLVYRIYTASETVGMIREAGFSRVDVYGDYDGREFRIDSPLFVAHARP